MLVKLSPHTEQVELLKSITGSRVASKAYEIAGRDYPGMLSCISKLQSEVEDLKQTIQVYQSIIDEARQAAVRLVEFTSQKDLFSD